MGVNSLLGVALHMTEGETILNIINIHGQTRGVILLQPAGLNCDPYSHSVVAIAMNHSNYSHSPTAKAVVLCLRPHSFEHNSQPDNFIQLAIFIKIIIKK
ncbi:hypothetical protein [Piscirickettsia salmonis]|uniref:hypothetical protein n=1 Tax=Piscirickettsia salmonis TaxID=1238 RepID=UPI0012BA8F18|nr:hypothetical protein [Piscirickettsia salmonis]